MHASHSSIVEAFHGFLSDCRLLLLRSSFFFNSVGALCVYVCVITCIFDSSNGWAQVLLRKISVAQ